MSFQLQYRPDEADSVLNPVERKFKEITVTFNKAWVEIELHWLSVLWDDDPSEMTEKDRQQASYLRNDVEGWQKLFTMDPTNIQMCMHMYNTLTKRSSDIMQWNVNSFKAGSEHGDLLAELLGVPDFDFWYLYDRMDDAAQAITRDTVQKLFKLSVLRGIFESEPLINELLDTVFSQTNMEMTPEAIMPAVIKQLFTSSLLKRRIDRMMSKKKSHKSIFMKMMLVLQLFCSNNNNNNKNQPDQKQGASPTPTAAEVMASQFTSEQMSKNLQIAEDQLKNTVRQWCYDAGVSSNLTDDQWTELFQVLNELGPLPDDTKEDEAKQTQINQERSVRRSKLLAQGWITAEQWQTVSEQYCKMGWHEINTDDLIPNLESTMKDMMAAACSNDPNAWKSILKEVTGEDIGSMQDDDSNTESDTDSDHDSDDSESDTTSNGAGCPDDHDEKA